MTSGGTDRKAIDAPRAAKTRTPLPVAAGEHAQGNADRGRHDQRRQAEEYGVRRPFADERRDWTPESKGFPEVEPQAPRQPVRILLAKRPIQPQPMPFGGQHRGVGSERVVAGSEMGEHERRRGHHEHEHCGEDGASEDEASKPAVHVLYVGSNARPAYVNRFNAPARPRRACPHSRAAAGAAGPGARSRRGQ